MDVTTVISGPGVAALGVLVALAAAGLALFGGGGANRRLKKRAVDLARRRRGQTPGNGAAASIVRGGGGRLDRLDGFAQKFLPNPAVLKKRLRRTGRRISIAAYLGVSAVIALVVFGLLQRLLGLGPAVGVLAAIAAAVWLPHMVVGRLADRHIARFTALLPDAIDLVVRGLKSGLPISESVAAVGRELAEPVGGEFRRVSDRVRFGETLEQALWETAGRLDTAEFKFFVISLSVQQETGGNLADTLANLSDILRKRRQMRLKVTAMASEARASAYILGSLPFIMLAILFLMNGEYVMKLFTDPRGNLALAGGLVTMGMGMLVMKRMVSFDI